MASNNPRASIDFTLASVLLFASVYMPKLQSQSFPLVIYFLFPISLYAFLYNNRLFQGALSTKKTLIFVSWICILSLYSYVISTFVGGGLDYSIPYNYLIWIALFVIPSFVSAILIVGSRYEYAGYKSIVAIAMAQAIFIILAALHPPTKEFFGVILEGDNAGHLMGWELRVVGLSGSGGAALSLTQAFGGCVGFFLFLSLQQKKWLLFSLVIAFSALPVGRSGVLWFTIFIGLFVPFYLLSKKNLKNISLSLFITFLSLQLLFNLTRNVEEVQLVLNFISTWSIEPLMYVMRPQNDPTVKAIAEMWNLPTGFDNYFFGSGWHVIDGHNLVGDPGYLRYFYFFGMFGVFLHYSFFLWVGWVLVTKSYGKKVKHLLFLIVVLLFIFELKEPFTMKIGALYYFMFFNTIAFQFRNRPYLVRESK